MQASPVKYSKSFQKFAEILIHNDYVMIPGTQIFIIYFYNLFYIIYYTYIIGIINYMSTLDKSSCHNYTNRWCGGLNVFECLAHVEWYY